MSRAARRATLALALDAAVVTAFVLIGRASHDSGPVIGALSTLWPFAAGLAIGWLGSRAWRHPLSIVRAGLPIWLTTVAVSLALRAVTGQGAPLSFAIVTAVTLAVFLLGWRAVTHGVAAVRRHRSTDVGGRR